MVPGKMAINLEKSEIPGVCEAGRCTKLQCSLWKTLGGGRERGSPPSGLDTLAGQVPRRILLDTMGLPAEAHAVPGEF